MNGPLSWLSRWLGWSSEGGESVARRRPGQARYRVVCISREAGAGGSTIAKRIAQRLGWRLYDEEIVETIAERMGLSLDQAKVFDELPPTRVQSWALPIFEEYYAPHETYLDHLGKLIEAIGQAGDAVVVGRGAGYVLPREETLSVRIVAPEHKRAERLSRRLGVSLRTAKRAARDLDDRRNRFARLQLGVDPTQAHHYDLILNSDRLGLELAAELVIGLVEAGRQHLSEESRLGLKSASPSPAGRPLALNAPTAEPPVPPTTTPIPSDDIEAVFEPAPPHPSATPLSSNPSSDLLRETGASE
ncbi:hypothetical protein Isop_3662 [Isosphaera pallida ATCC 43644]|uniref:Cytidylate kinase n=2 Tax=Isosphaera pallida TaxID=128 RepID=E8QZ89_ISOPI|nr:hypothetical protein Isop_3662 [Isosphaera pallida ATCC 43644]